MTDPMPLEMPRTRPLTIALAILPASAARPSKASRTPATPSANRLLMRPQAVLMMVGMALKLFWLAATITAQAASTTVLARFTPVSMTVFTAAIAVVTAL